MLTIVTLVYTHCTHTNVYNTVQRWEMIVREEKPIWSWDMLSADLSKTLNAPLLKHWPGILAASVSYWSIQSQARFSLVKRSRDVTEMAAGCGRRLEVGVDSKSSLELYQADDRSLLLCK